MSRDIRSFFGTVSSKKGTSEAKTEAKRKDSGRTQKKKRAVIESDSEDEIFTAKKKSVSVSQTNANPKHKAKENGGTVINAAEMFGSGPIKRTPREVSKKSTEVHDDPEIEEVLLDIDESIWLSESSSSQPQSSSKSGVEVSLSPGKRPSKGSTSNDGGREMVVEKNISPFKLEKKSSPVQLEQKASQVEVGKKGSPVKQEKDVPLAKRQPNKAAVNEDKISSIKVLRETEALVDLVGDKRKEQEPSPCTGGKRKRDETNVSQELRDSKVSRISAKEVLDKSCSKEALKESKLNNMTVPEPSCMWVDKYKPTSVKQIIGQQGEASNVKKLMRWLSSWHSNHGPGANKKLIRPSPWAKDDSGSYFKAALLSGPPGVGKTTTAHLVCKELGMDVVEFNASDTRSKKLMNQEVTALLTNESLNPYFQSGGESKTSAKHVLLMDEVDGMAGNEDRGGVQELINLIKNSKCPVICMCNDRNHPKIRSLANYCYDLRFHKPRLEQIRGAMMSVCFKEKVTISPEALNEVIAGTNCDIRQVLHHLSMWCSSDKKLSPDQARTDASAAKKNIKLGPWDALRKVFSAEDHKTMSLIDKSDLFFHDYNIMPLFVQENYLIASPHAAKKGTQLLKHIAQAAISISHGDLIEKTIRSRNDAWSLLPVQSSLRAEMLKKDGITMDFRSIETLFYKIKADDVRSNGKFCCPESPDTLKAMFASVVPGEMMEGHLTGQIQFPAWLGKNSRRNKMDRLLQELQMHMRLSISGGKQAVNLEYLPHLQNAVIHPLVEEGASGVPRTLQVMQDYYLTREDLDSVLELNQWPGQPDAMAKVESKVKAALTRAYNKGGVMIPYALEAPIKKRIGLSAVPDDELPSLDEDVIDANSDSEDEDALDAMIKAKKTEKKTNAGGEGPSASKGRGSRGGGKGSSQTRGRGRGKPK